MRALDAWAIDDRGTEGMLLMEEAGRQLAAVVEERHPRGHIVVLCGPGNNGGDGYIAARFLRDAGRLVTVVAVGAAEALRGDAAVALERLTGPGPVPFTEGTLTSATVIVDALLGTGAAGAPRGVFAEVISSVCRSGVPVVSADVPSGVDASTGEIGGVAVRAEQTVTFAAQKLGLWIAPGKAHAGEVCVAALPYPGRWPVQPTGMLLGSDAVRAVPRRGARSTKFSSGHVLIVGGSIGLSGAPILAAGGAMRAGAGYVTLGVPSGISATVDHHLVEAMPMPLPGPATHLTAASAPAIEEHLLHRGGALVLGPGLGSEDDARALVAMLLETPVPLVLDADGLNALRGGLATLAGREAATVLTPHVGELGRLLDRPSEEVAARRLHHAQAAADAACAVVVLKGDDTIVAVPGGGSPAISRGDAPALATAGTGDVLSGVIGALLAQGIPADDAACAAVVVHAEAGRRAAAAVGGADGVIASDVVRALPAALTALRGDADVSR